jgi:hypothetical protein
MEEVQAARREILRMRPEALPPSKKPHSMAATSCWANWLCWRCRLENHVKAIQALGVIVKDIDAGLVGLPALRNGREIYLCWRYGEERLGFWHELNTRGSLAAGP